MPFVIQREVDTVTTIRSHTRRIRIDYLKCVYDDYSIETTDDRRKALLFNTRAKAEATVRAYRISSLYEIKPAL
ncbi:MAG TPA: hypothetical protein VEY71_04720 [Chitinophagales bacterium]|nr:hypothetical protein [Chitinophagales bacterium]